MNYYSVGPEVNRIKFLTSGKIHNKCTAFQLNCNAVHLLWILPDVRKFILFSKNGKEKSKGKKLVLNPKFSSIIIQIDLPVVIARVTMVLWHLFSLT